MNAPTGAKGPKGDCITEYVTANSIALQKVEEEGAIVYGQNTAEGGSHIEHEANTAEFILEPEHTYSLSLFVSSNAEKETSFYFTVKLCDEVIGALHSGIVKGYNGAGTYLCFTTPPGIPSVLRIVNACGETASSINSSIGIMQISS